MARINEISFRISKAGTSADGTRRFLAVVSDTGVDREGQRTSLELFADWIDRADGKKLPVKFLPPPEKPFLSVAHYRALDGYGVAGVVDKMYIDGDRFKVGGTFSDNKVGNALFDAVVADIAQQKSGAASQPPIRISAGWYDLQHMHADGSIFTPKSATDRCEYCARNGDIGVIYQRGQLEHMAATRLPVNPRTEIGLETKSMETPTTIKDDAASIVGDEIADELDIKSRVKTKSGAKVVTKADADPNVPDEKAPAAADDGKEQPAAVDGVTCPECGALLDDVHIGDQCPECGHEFTADDLANNPPAPSPPNEKSQAKLTRRKSMFFGGAKTIDAARAFIERVTMKSAIEPPSNWDILRGVVSNIANGTGSPTSKIRRIMRSMSDFGDEIEALKSAADNTYLMYRDSKETPTPPDKVGDTPEPEYDGEYGDAAKHLVGEVNAALQATGMTKDDRLKKIQAALEVFADVVRRQVENITPETEESAAAIDRAVQAAVTPLLDKIAELSQKIDELNGAPTPPTLPPAQKSIVAKPAARPPAPRKKLSVRDIARQSTGL